MLATVQRLHHHTAVAAAAPLPPAAREGDAPTGPRAAEVYGVAEAVFGPSTEGAPHNHVACCARLCAAVPAVDRPQTLPVLPWLTRNGEGCAPPELSLSVPRGSGLRSPWHCSMHPIVPAHCLSKTHLLLPGVPRQHLTDAGAGGHIPVQGPRQSGPAQWRDETRAWLRCPSCDGRDSARCPGCEATSAATVREAAAGGHAVAAASWHALGRPDLAATAAATVVACYSADVPIGAAAGATAEVALAYAQLAVIAYERRGYP